MSNMKKLFGGCLVSLCCMTACQDPNEGSLFIEPTNIDSEMSVSGILRKYDSEFSMWIEMLKYTDFYNALNNPDIKATVFCPTNEAVEAFLDWRGVESIDELDPAYAKEVVQVHILDDKDLIITDSLVSSLAASGEEPISIPSLFGSYLSLTYGYTVTDVDDVDYTGEVLHSDSIYINNQARLDKFTSIKAINGRVFTMGDVIRPLSETILEKLRPTGEYNLFIEAAEACGYDKIAAKMRDTTYSVTGMTITNYTYTCFAVPDIVYHEEGINTVDELKIYLQEADGEYAHTNPDSTLYNYMAYHFLSRQYPTSELFAFLEDGQTLIYDTKLPSSVILTQSVDGENVINKEVKVLRSDIEARNGRINKIDHIMPVMWNPEPVTVIWDFCNSAEIISFVNAYGKANSYGDLFTTPLTNSYYQVDLSEDRYDKDYGVLTGFTYQARDSKASVKTYRKVGYYKEKAKKAGSTEGEYGFYMNNALMLNLGHTGWSEMETPTIIAGKYRVELCYGSDIGMMGVYNNGSATSFRLDDYSAGKELYKGLMQKLFLGSGVDVVTLWSSVTFEESGTHKFKATMNDIQAKSSATYHQMYDYIKFIPID